MLLAVFRLLPLWILLSHRIGKKRTWILSMLLNTGAFTGVFLLGPGDVSAYAALVFLSGLGLGATLALPSSLQADVIDYDEYRTGERKEGAYFALWNFIRKAANGIMGALAGVALQFSGFVPNAEQSPETQQWLSFLYAGVPGIAMLIGAWMFFAWFRFDAKHHQRIRTELDERN